MECYDTTCIDIIDNYMINTGCKPLINHKQIISKSHELREEKIREDKEKIREDKIPTYDEFKNYALENEPNINLKSLELKYKAWCENNWKDGNNKPIKNWKSKLLNTIPHLGKNKIKSTINTVWDEKNR